MTDASNTQTLPADLNITDWLEQLTPTNLTLALNELELRMDGGELASLQRIYRRLMGFYVEDDFAPNDNMSGNLLKSHRDLIRFKYITKMVEEFSVVEASGTDNQSQRHDPVANSTLDGESQSGPGNGPGTTYTRGLPQVDNTTVVTTTTTTPTTTVHTVSSGGLPNVNALRYLAWSTNDGTSRLSAQATEMDSVCLMNGRRVIVPKDISDEYRLLKELAAGCASRIEHMPCNFASSTRLQAPQEPYGGPTSQNTRRPRMVNFEDTAPPLRDRTVPFTSTNRSLSTTMDVGRTVRGWKLTFSGEKGHSIEEFLRRVDECNRLVGLSEADLLNALTEMLNGVALQWFRMIRETCHTWYEFTTAARRQFGPQRHSQSRVLREAQQRTQGEDEPSHEYIFKLLTIINRIEEPWSDMKKLELLYDNLRPEIKKLIPIERLSDVQTLCRQAEEAEYLLQEEKVFREPPPMEKCLFKDTAYAPKSKKQTAAPKIAAAQTNKEEKTPESNQLAELRKELAAVKKQLTEIPPKVPDKKEGPKEDRPQESTGNQPGRRPWKRKERKPTSDKNAGKDPGPIPGYNCYGCSWPGYMLSMCPDCSGKGKGSA